MNATLYGRTLVGDSLGFHILFALLGVGIPFLILMAEGIGLMQKDEAWLATARTWSHLLVVLFITGAVSGTIISIQFSMVWPRFMTIASQTVGLSFFLEGFAFLVEALFLGLYMLTWRRWVGTWRHFLVDLPIVIGSFMSAFFITTVNAFMNAPQGFSYSGGNVTNIHPWQAIFNPATATETSHSIISYYLTTAAVFAAWYAWRSIKEKKVSQHRQQLLAVLASIMLLLALAMGITGDASAKYLAQYEPAKFAAAEVLFKTQANAPIHVGGIIRDNTIHGAITIPGLLSWLTYGATNAVVRGLDTVSPQMWPPLVVHYFFDAMVGIGTLLVLIPLLYLGLRWQKPKLAENRFMLWLLVLAGPLAALAVEFGWMLTEIGRQPYAIHGLLLTNDAITPSPDVIRAASIFPMLYLLLLAATLYALKRWPPEKHA